MKNRSRKTHLGVAVRLGEELGQLLARERLDLLLMRLQHEDPVQRTAREVFLPHRSAEQRVDRAIEGAHRVRLSPDILGISQERRAFGCRLLTSRTTSADHDEPEEQTAEIALCRSNCIRWCDRRTRLSLERSQKRSQNVHELFRIRG